RDSPPLTLAWGTAAYSFGERPGVCVRPAAFQSALPPAVLLPESFRGGCSFGAAAPDVRSGRDLSCGRAYGSSLFSTAGRPRPAVTRPGRLTEQPVALLVDHLLGFLYRKGYRGLAARLRFGANKAVLL